VIVFKLLEKKSMMRPNEIVRTFFDCKSIGDAQSRLATRRGCPVRDYFVTDAEWRAFYSPAAQKGLNEPTEQEEIHCHRDIGLEVTR
jgi:hypothetical protein